MPEPFLHTLRHLVTCYQAFEAYSGAHIRELGLTPPQFDVIATLGNTDGLSCRELGERTLITKGTLTGVLDRLEARKLVRRESVAEDRRSVFVRLTRAGEKVFETVFPAHVAYLRRVFGELAGDELATLDRLLARLARRFAPGADDEPAAIPATPKSRMIAAARRGA